jgi:5-methylcytosine-specific restriction protein A
MEKRVDIIVFRRMTYADFRHINKVGGEEKGGGGQSYIDFPTKDIPLNFWFDFLGENSEDGKVGPIWEFNLNSLGLNKIIKLKIYQRREQSVCIAAQKIHSRESNRVPSWHPANGFPEDYNPEKENLVIYIVNTKDGEYWAGWFLQDQVPVNWIGNRLLSRLFTDIAGCLKFRKRVFIETSNTLWPFYFNANSIVNDIPTEEDIEDELVLEDTSPKLQDLIDNDEKPDFRKKLFKIRQRNNKIVKNLKKLYKGKCQISGVEFTFKKKNGEFYSEVHHLIPLGENGSDDYANAIVLSPLVHRMLHFAKVSTIDLSLIKNNKLKIKINDEDFEISWHPDHMKIVEKSLKD